MVRKISSTDEYNSRLKAQCFKQKMYKSSLFKTPAIINSGNIDNLFFFDMEYIPGTTISEYMKTISLSEITKLSDSFKSIIPENIIFNLQLYRYIEDKINDLITKIHEDTYRFYLEYLRKCNWDYLTESYCHGDFTLENMILYNDDIYLIDYLDSFFNSWMVDIAKILQDVQLGWSYRYESMDINLNLRLIVLRDSILGYINSIENGSEIIRTIYQILLLNLIRIVPYCKDYTTSQFLLNSTKKIFNILESKQ